MSQLSNYTLHPKPLTQKGFAPILLVILALVGITAATLLIQTSTNFLPKAADSLTECSFKDIDNGNKTFSHCEFTTVGSNVEDLNRCREASRTVVDLSTFKLWCKPSDLLTWNPIDDNALRIRYNSLCYSYPKGKARDWIVKKGSTRVYGGVGECDSPDRPCADLNAYCKNQNQECIKDDNFQAHCGNPSQTIVGTPTTAAADQANGISSTTCSNDQKRLCETELWQPKGGCVITTTGLRQCKYEANREGDKCNNDPAHPETGAACGSKECRVIEGLPRCITTTCTQPEKTGCEAKGATCEIGTKKIEGVDKNYTYCKPGSSAAAPAAGGPAANPASAANRSTTSTAAAPAAASTTKTPWGKDADGDSKLISEIFKQAVQAIPDLKNAKDAIDGAKTAKASYETGFKEAYSKIFKADISKDPDALAVLNTQANYVAVHAYTSIDPAYKGKAWDPSNLKGAIDNLKTNGIIPQAADLSKITPPNAVPGSAGTPTKKTIDAGVAVDCGSDIDGTKIPCYKMGVFASYDDLKATEAEASIATQRYAKSQEILNEVKGKVNDTILAAAQAKLTAAKDKATACMKK